MTQCAPWLGWRLGYDPTELPQFTSGKGEDGVGKKSAVSNLFHLFSLLPNVASDVQEIRFVNAHGKQYDILLMYSPRNSPVLNKRAGNTTHSQVPLCLSRLQKALNGTTIRNYDLRPWCTRICAKTLDFLHNIFVSLHNFACPLREQN
jgi:hypothetical protein